MFQFNSVAQSCPTLCDPIPGVHSDSRPSSQWCHPAILSSVVPFSSCLQSLPALGSFPISQFFTWSSQSIGVSALASVLPKNTQDWSSLGCTGWNTLQSKGLSRVFSNIAKVNSSEEAHGEVNITDYEVTAPPPFWPPKSLSVPM